MPLPQHHRWELSINNPKWWLTFPHKAHSWWWPPQAAQQTITMMITTIHIISFLSAVVATFVKALLPITMEQLPIHNISEWWSPPHAWTTNHSPSVGLELDNNRSLLLSVRIWSHHRVISILEGLTVVLNSRRCQLSKSSQISWWWAVVPVKGSLVPQNPNLPPLQCPNSRQSLSSSKFTCSHQPPPPRNPCSQIQANWTCHLTPITPRRPLSTRPSN